MKKAGCTAAELAVKDGTATHTGTVGTDVYIKCIQAVNEAKPKDFVNQLKKN